ncbi:MAG: hypothetical protein IJU07_03730 [Synergistaceae bacterium]|nr:hypothetical protein [Synergistaceae bacterium]
MPLVQYRTNKISGTKFAFNKGIEALKAAGRTAKENGIVYMTLEEINAEIAEARKMLNS